MTIWSQYNICRHLFNGDGKTACVLLRNLLQQAWLSAPLWQDTKSLVGSQVELICRFLIKSKIIFISSCFEGGIWGRLTQMSFINLFSLILFLKKIITGEHRTQSAAEKNPFKKYWWWIYIYYFVKEFLLHFSESTESKNKVI